MAWIETVLTLGEGQGIDYRKLALAGLDTGGRSGILTWEGVHWCMSGLQPEEKAILYLKYNPPRASGMEIANLTTRLWILLDTLESRHRPKIPETLTPAELALLLAAQERRDHRQSSTVNTVLNEHIDTKLCDRCRTSGAKYPGKIAENIAGQGLVWTTCDKCQGRQLLPWSDNKRASNCTGDRALWKTRYEPNYLRLLGECSNIAQDGAETLKKRLFGEPEIESRMQARA